MLEHDYTDDEIRQFRREALLEAYHDQIHGGDEHQIVDALLEVQEMGEERERLLSKKVAGLEWDRQAQGKADRAKAEVDRILLGTGLALIVAAFLLRGELPGLLIGIALVLGFMSVGALYLRLSDT